MTKRCANCLIGFEGDEDYHTLCGEGYNDCWSTVGRYGDAIAVKMWGAVGTLVNLKLESADLEALSDSPAFLDLMSRVLSEKDATMRIQWLKKEIGKL